MIGSVNAILKLSYSTQQSCYDSKRQCCFQPSPRHPQISLSLSLSLIDCFFSFVCSLCYLVSCLLDNNAWIAILFRPINGPTRWALIYPPCSLCLFCPITPRVFFFFQIKFMEISLTLNNLLKEKGFSCMIISKMCSIQAACHHFVWILFVNSFVHKKFMIWIETF